MELATRALAAIDPSITILASYLLVRTEARIDKSPTSLSHKGSSGKLQKLRDFFFKKHYGYNMYEE